VKLIDVDTSHTPEESAHSPSWATQVSSSIIIHHHPSSSIIIHHHPSSSIIWGWVFYAPHPKGGCDQTTAEALLAALLFYTTFGPHQKSSSLFNKNRRTQMFRFRVLYVYGV
jgi:hypothetical protein